MKILNVHERRIGAPTAEVGALIESLGSPDDRLWPGDRWPPMRLDAGLTRGSKGGHGPIRYSVSRREPGCRVTFRFHGPPGLVGEHRFELEAADDRTVLLRHVVEGRAKGRMLFAWPVVFRPLHDALLEDALDRAESEVGRAPSHPRSWSSWVRILRRVLQRGARRRLRRLERPAGAGAGFTRTAWRSSGRSRSR